jgi:peptide/nickel transport system substrate-binding protein
VTSLKHYRLVSCLFLVLTLLASLVPLVSQAAVTGPSVRIHVTDSVTSLNANIPEFSFGLNGEVSSLRFSGFTVENKFNELQPNSVFGSYRIISNSPFRVEYSIKPGRVWSDGVPITAVDLLLHHIICSSQYSEVAGLGNPKISGSSPAFKSSCYGSKYDENISGITLSDDRLSVTLFYSKYFSDWEAVAPEPFPVHTLVLLAEGSKRLPEANEGNLAREKFLRAYLTNDRSTLLRYGDVWSNSYKIETINRATNPLLLVGNGGYIPESAEAKQAFTLVYNERYNSGPAVGGVARLIFRTIADGNTAVQALRNGEIDLYTGQPTSDAASLLKTIPNVNVFGFKQGIYEHIDLRTSNTRGTNQQYNGIFAGNSERARDLRRAFLLTIPREEIYEKIITPINGLNNQFDSLLDFPGSPTYETLRAKSGIDYYTAGSIQSRRIRALALVQKHFPNASPSNPIAKVNFLHGTPANARRAAVVSLIKASALGAGFDVNAPGVATWSQELSSKAWDVAMFAWVRFPSYKLKNADFYSSDGANNYSGWSNSVIDSNVNRLNAAPLLEADFTSALVSIESQIYAEGLSLPLFQHPGVLAVRNNLKNVSPTGNTFPVTWNYWEWSYNDSKPFPLYVAPVVTSTPSATPSPSPSAVIPSYCSNASFGSPSTKTGRLDRISDNIVQVQATMIACSYEVIVVSDNGETFRTGIVNSRTSTEQTITEQFINAKCTTGYSFSIVTWSELNGKGIESRTASNRMLSATCAPSSIVKPSTPTFSGVNFVGNKIDINVNLGSSASSRPDKVYLVAPKLGVNSSTPLEGKISGSTASWSLPLNNILSGVAIPLEIVGEKNGVKSEPLTGSYTKPATSLTSVPPAPSNYTSRIVGSSAIVSIQVSAKENSRAASAHLYSSALGIKKNPGLKGDVVGNKALIEIPIKASMAGKKYPLTIYLKNSKGESKPLNATLTIPRAPKAPTVPTVLPKPSVPETVICTRLNQTRTFEGNECPLGWERR